MESMTFRDALSNPIYTRYLIIIGALLAIVGVILAFLKFVLKKDVHGVLAIYKGWLFMAPCILICVGLGREATIIAAMLIAGFGFKEFARATGLYNDWWMTSVVYLNIIGMSIVTLMMDPNGKNIGWFGMFRTLPVYAVALILLIPILRNTTRGQLQAVSLAIVGFIYLGWMFAHWGFLANSNHPYGYLLYLIFAVEINDVSAFLFGKMFGQHKLRSEVSPNKTWEGSIGAFCVSMCLPWILSFSFPHFGPVQKILTGLIIGVGGQLGDLSISVIKRDIGIKDMGAAIPGHGGVLDRIDSLIYTAPLFMHMINWFYGLYGTR